MKKYIISLIVFLLMANSQLLAQHDNSINDEEVEGIYLTVDDFRNGNLTRPTDRLHKGEKIKLKQFFLSPEIIGIEKGVETIYYKDSIFAIHMINNENYRFINRTPCLIVDTSYLFIYTNKTTMSVCKMAGPHRRQREVLTTNYFFTTCNHKVNYSLSLSNLQKYAAFNSEVFMAVFNKFKTDEMLEKINTGSGRFELNETILSVLK